MLELEKIKEYEEKGVIVRYNNFDDFDDLITDKDGYIEVEDY